LRLGLGEARIFELESMWDVRIQISISVPEHSAIG